MTIVLPNVDNVHEGAKIEINFYLKRTPKRTDNKHINSRKRRNFMTSLDSKNPYPVSSKSSYNPSNKRAFLNKNKLENQSHKSLGIDFYKRSYDEKVFNVDDSSHPGDDVFYASSNTFSVDSTYSIKSYNHNPIKSNHKSILTRSSSSLDSLNPLGVGRKNRSRLKQQNPSLSTSFQTKKILEQLRKDTKSVVVPSKVLCSKMKQEKKKGRVFNRLFLAKVPKFN
mmetsp:Transcript_11901/g.17696  ORF Transcript_11901/g.17696 Transcript_11901/m.17696 type:complete len:225 (+) Transcript_11901:28-702(+)